MDSTVRVRRNHYETPGPKPTASDQEIEEGFARAMGSPRREGVAPELPIPQFLASGRKRNGYPRVGKQQVVDWKYPTFALGSLVLGVVLIGAWAGAHAEDAPAKSPGPTLTVALPPAEATSETVQVPAHSSSSGDAEPEFISPALIERARQRIRARASVARLAGSGSVPESPARGAAATIAQQPRALEAKLPLPNHVIVRTIERIGYACGAVASATALEGDEPGAYKVTCTSGQSYQARPVHGRYHFRRW
jgi:hypothetical protein